MSIRPDHCPVGGEPCQSMCDEPCKWSAPSQSSDKDIRKAYERAFTGANRTALSWTAYQAGWNAAKGSR